MRSMTGYGYAEYACDEYILTMELKSYNNRYLEVNYFSPSVLSSYENEINEIVKGHAQRGHIDLSIKIKNLKGCGSISVDEVQAAEYIRALKKIAEVAKNEKCKVDKISLSDVARYEGVLNSASVISAETYRAGLDYCSTEVMKQFDASKDREGLATKNDLAEKINSIEKSRSVVISHADELEKLIKEGLLNRIHEMLDDKSYDENRVLTEVAVMLNRYTVNEEIVRLGAHIEEFKRLLENEDAVGKRMDFLCQEMNREINTIGSKSQIAEINFEVVNMKDCLENIREQIRNIE